LRPGQVPREADDPPRDPHQRVARLGERRGAGLDRRGLLPAEPARVIRVPEHRARHRLVHAERDVGVVPLPFDRLLAPGTTQFLLVVIAVRQHVLHEGEQRVEVGRKARSLDRRRAVVHLERHLGRERIRPLLESARRVVVLVLERLDRVMGADPGGVLPGRELDPNGDRRRAMVLHEGRGRPRVDRPGDDLGGGIDCRADARERRGAQEKSG